MKKRNRLRCCLSRTKSPPRVDHTPVADAIEYSDDAYSVRPGPAGSQLKGSTVRYGASTGSTVDRPASQPGGIPRVVHQVVSII